MESKHAPRTIVLGFILVIVLGACALLLPWMAHEGFSISIVDALFMSASAISGTGLAVFDVPTVLTPAGKTVLLVLMEIGGLGIMVLSSFVLILLGKRLSLQSQLYWASELSPTAQLEKASALKMVLIMVGFAVGVELAGAMVMFVRFLHRFPAGDAAYHAVFHSVSAFCTAGLSTFSTSLNEYATDPWIVVTNYFLMFLGEIGFAVVVGIYAQIFYKMRMPIHSKMVVVITLALTLMGFFTTMIFDGRRLVAELGWIHGPLNAFFFTLSGRATGFTTIATTAFTLPSIFVMMILMFIGGSPGSTASGMKTTTLGVHFLIYRSMIRGRQDIDIAGRRLPHSIEAKAVAVTVVMFLSVVLCAPILLYTETAQVPGDHGRFLVILFEEVSALGNVGYSLGLTPFLTVPGKLVLTLLMFLGRIGPLTLALAIGSESEKVYYRYPEEDVIIG